MINSTQQPIETIVYRIDDQDIVTYVNDCWDAFAADNDGASILAGTILGKRLWDFITGDPTVDLYRHLIRSVRGNQRPLAFHFRCDSPGLKRHMHMTVKPLDSGCIEFSNDLLKLERRNPKAWFKGTATGSKHFVFMCSICNKVKEHGGGEWLEVDAAFSDTLSSSDKPLLTMYRICDQCSRNIEEECRVFA